MSGTEIDRPGARRNAELISRAAKRAGWAGTALENAAGDLSDAHGGEGRALTGLAEVVLEQAERVSHLAEDIESQRPVPESAAT
jgi:hypothetical protein